MKPKTLLVIIHLSFLGIAFIVLKLTGFINWS